MWAFPVPPPGAEAFWLVAQDQDNDKLTYGISGPDASVFSVTPTTGEVKLASPLDYEVNSSGLGRPQEGCGEVGALPVPSPRAEAHLGPLLPTRCRPPTCSTSSSL